MEGSITTPAWSALKKLLISRLFIGHHTVVWFLFRNHEGSTFTEKDRNKLYYRIGPNHRVGPGCAGRAKLQ